jgi:NADH:ubiquinone oxidoreductase subunit D
MIEEVGTTTEGDIIINVGPQHPPRMVFCILSFTLHGETIRKVEPTWDISTAR